MRVYRQGEGFQKPAGGCVLALGSFDALHLAHQQLIQTVVSFGRKQGLASGVYLFERRPEKVLAPERDTQSLYDNQERIHILETMGVDFAYFAKFDEAMRHMDARQFATMLISVFDVRQVCVGFHYRFGYRGEGDARTLIALGAELGFGVQVLEPIRLDGDLISSTRVRECIRAGEVRQAARLLGRPYTFCGEVEADRGVGRGMQIPTANLVPDPELVHPANGVYATFACVDENRYRSITNVGVRPTFGLHQLRVETHLLDYKGDLYGKRLRLEFIERLRGEIRFESKEALKAQIVSDMEKVREILRENPRC